MKSFELFSKDFCIIESSSFKNISFIDSLLYVIFYVVNEQKHFVVIELLTKCSY
jgi:hypothetical protein